MHQRAGRDDINPLFPRNHGDQQNIVKALETDPLNYISTLDKDRLYV